MKTSQHQIQKQILAPILQQSIEVLLLPIQELDQAIEQELQSNPLLEIKEEKKSEPLEATRPLEVKTREQEYDLPSSTFAENSPFDGEIAEDRAFKQECTLEDELLRQLKCETSDALDIKIGEFIIGNIDEDGYLKVTIEEIAEAVGTPDHAPIYRVLDIIQSCEPAGIAARDLKECLLIQARIRIKTDQELVIKIISECLEELGKRQHPQIAKKIKVSPERIKNACGLIATLDPRPARNCRAVKSNIYIRPDVTILKNADNHYLINVNRDGIPQLTVNTHYKAMLKQSTLSKEEREFIRERLQSAVNFIKSVDQRYQTIQAISEYILKKQKAFFTEGHDGLVPMNLREVAQTLDRNESTISRAIKDKYLETPHGTFPFKFFFSQGLESSNEANPNHQVANRSIKEDIRRMIEDETKSAPLSDQDIQKHFEQQGIKIARRTVAKYRQELNILPTHLRKA